MLQSAGFATIEAFGRVSALTAVEAGNVDVAMIDVQLPDDSGVAVLRRLREARPGLPAIFMSGHERQDIPGIADALFLAKPFDGTQLTTTVTRALASRS
jgi:two-component system cell cycle sensor histidine kinase/response regulator CckA